MIKKFNAAYAPLAPSYVRGVLNGEQATECESHPAQLAAWENLTFVCAEVLAEEIDMQPEEIAKFLKQGPQTICGIPVKVNLSMPKTSLCFKNAAGEVIGMIENLAIPVGFAADLA